MRSKIGNLLPDETNEQSKIRSTNYLSLLGVLWITFQFIPIVTYKRLRFALCTGCVLPRCQHGISIKKNKKLTLYLRHNKMYVT